MCRDMTALKSAHQMPLSEPHPYQTNYNSIPPQTFLQKMSAAVFQSEEKKDDNEADTSGDRKIPKSFQKILERTKKGIKHDKKEE